MARPALLLATWWFAPGKHHPMCTISTYFRAGSKYCVVYFSECTLVRAQSRTSWVGTLLLRRVPGGGDAALGTECLERRFEI